MYLPESINEMYSDLLTHRCGVKVAKILEVDVDIYHLAPEELLQSCGVDFDSALYYEASQNETEISGYGDSEYVKGWVSNYIKDENLHSVIFVIKDPKYDGNELEGWEHQEFLSLLKYLTLLHELGHVDDFNNGNNFFHETRTVDLTKAEAYADIFAIKYLKNKRHPYEKLALKTFCKGILVRARTGHFYSEVHKEITKKVLEPQIRKWALTK
ncbi:hypothetical protein ACLIOB_003503, partial [Vibrio cholerae]|nr:hypothetical protein [Vibrio cholerae]HDB1451086.1 hypothetical protein [Vibrio cholerae]